MKTRRWVLGTIYVLSFSVLLGVLGTCDLQDKPKSEPAKPFYRLMASGFGAVISTIAGYTYISKNHYDNSHYTRTNAVESWGSNGNYSEGGWWQEEIPEDNIYKYGAQENDESAGLFLKAINQGGAGGPLTTRIIYVDDNGNEKVLSEVSTQADNFCESYAHPWTRTPPSPPNPSDFHPGGPGLTVICTELHRQGLMDGTIFKADEAFGKYLRENQKEVLIGYRFWAKPVVSLMQKSRVFTQIVNVFAKPWSHEMAYRVGARSEGTFVGKILMEVGVPICRLIGWSVIWAGNMGNP